MQLKKGAAGDGWKTPAEHSICRLHLAMKRGEEVLASRADEPIEHVIGGGTWPCKGIEEIVRQLKKGGSCTAQISAGEFGVEGMGPAELLSAEIELVEWDEVTDVSGDGCDHQPLRSPCLLCCLRCARLF